MIFLDQLMDPGLGSESTCIPGRFSRDINIMSTTLSTRLHKLAPMAVLNYEAEDYIAKGPATERTTVVDCASDVSDSKSLESATMMAGSFRLTFSALMSFTTPDSLTCERPATAHFKSVGQF
jgi:hypothetical protein